MPTVPFGSNAGYEFGVLPTNLPTLGEYGASQDAADAYVDFVNDWVEYCGDNRARIKWSTTSQTVSEGVAYGMLLAAYAGDKDLFDRLWAFYEYHMNDRGVMDWKTEGCNGVAGQNGASDAEFDAAMALIVADYQWPGTTSPHNYETDAKDLIRNILDWEVDFVTNPGPQLSNGDGWLGYASGGAARTGSNNSRNPSYQCPAYINVWKDFLGEEPQTFENLLAATYTLLENNVHSSTGLCSDWCTPDGTPTVNKFADESSRFPWRMGVDVLWNNAAQPQVYCNKMLSATTSGANTAYNSNGGDNPSSVAISSDPNVIYTSGWLSSTVASTNASEQDRNDFYTATVDDDEIYYFQSCLRAIGLFVATGNFWKPGSELGLCSRPDLGNDLSICGSSSLELNSNMPTGQNRQFTWKKGTETVAGPSSDLNVYLAVEPGVYTVEVDSGNGECVVSDEIEIFGVLPEVDLGEDVELCSPAMATLTANVAGNGIQYTWEHNANTLVTESSSSLTVYEQGIYKLIITATGCSAQFDEVIVTSKLPEVAGYNGCPGEAMLEVLSTGGPYEWYSDAEGGEVLEVGDVFMPTVTEDIIYYVNDAGSIESTVGYSATNHPLSSQENGGAIGVQFTAEIGFEIKGLTVLPYVYGCNGETVYVDFELQDADNGNEVVASGRANGSVCVQAQSQTPLTDMYELTFDLPLDVPGAGNYILKPSGGNQLIWFKAGADFNELTYPGVLSINDDTRNDVAVSFPGIFDILVSTGNNCDRTPVLVEIDCPTGNEEEEGQLLQLYPNPFESTTTVNVEDYPVIMNILDVSGKVVQQVDIQGNSALTFGEKFDPGTYFVEIISENGNRKVQKLVKY